MAMNMSGITSYDGGMRSPQSNLREMFGGENEIMLKGLTTLSCSFSAHWCQLLLLSPFSCYRTLLGGSRNQRKEVWHILEPRESSA